jgi:RimJ/RimL family protein N-acetyltransferase
MIPIGKSSTKGSVFLNWILLKVHLSCKMTTFNIFKQQIGVENMNIQTIQLEGSRAMLLPMQQSHAQELWEAGKDPNIWEFTYEPIQTFADTELWVHKILAEQSNGTSLPFSVYDKETKRIIGSTRLFDISVSNKHLEIGHTWYNSSFWRTRINTECKYLLLQHCFETLGTIRVQIKTDLRNTRSQAAINRLGAVKEGILRQHRILPDGYIRDTVFFSVLDKEWPDVKARLEGFL